MFRSLGRIILFTILLKIYIESRTYEFIHCLFFNKLFIIYFNSTFCRSMFYSFFTFLNLILTNLFSQLLI